jgi:methionine biosynthesis protein MetW
MIIKDFLFKLKEDLKRLFLYPDADLEKKYNVDYDAYWAKRDMNRGERPILRSWPRQRAEFLSKLIEPGSTVLDIGCGNGAVLLYVKEKIGIRAIGVDLGIELLDQAKKFGIETITMDVTDISKLKELPEADYIIGFEILEHMPLPEAFLHEVRRKAKKGMFYSFPNTGYYLHRLRLLTGRFPLQWISHPGEHVRYWTVRDVKWWVKALNFDLSTLIVYEGLPGLNKIMPKLFGQGIFIGLTERKNK